MQLQGQVGAPVTSYGPGTQPSIRTGQQADLIAEQLHGKNYETNYRVSLFSTFINALTIVSTHASPIAAGTGTPIISVFNPAGSGKNVSLLRMQQAHTSGTAAGPLLWNIIPNPQNISAANTTAYMNFNNAQTSSVTRIFNNVALTASTIGTAFRSAGGPSSAASLTGAVQTFAEDFQGDLIIQPGFMLALAATGTGTSHVLSVYLEWEELPI